jgi:FkbM family methyltransferase
MLTAMSTGQRLKALAWWGLNLFRNATDWIAGRPPRFLLLTPAFLRKQVIYDRTTGAFVRVEIRDIVDFWVIRQIFGQEDYGLYKLSRGLELERTYRAIVASGKTPLILDCGANCGMATRFFVETYPDARVVAVEPIAANVELARLNNSKGNVSFHLAGIGSADTRASIQDPGMGNWAFRVEEDASGTTSIVSINTLVNAYDPQTHVPFLVKIDIEGFESNLFEKNTEWIDLFPVLIIELHDWMLPGQANARRFLQQISSRDRDFVFFGENVFSIANPAERKKLTESGSVGSQD